MDPHFRLSSGANVAPPMFDISMRFSRPRVPIQRPAFRPLNAQSGARKPCLANSGLVWPLEGSPSAVGRGVSPSTAVLSDSFDGRLDVLIITRKISLEVERVGGWPRVRLGFNARSPRARIRLSPWTPSRKSKTLASSSAIDQELLYIDEVACACRR